jgi:hypothetical protein
MKKSGRNEPAASSMSPLRLTATAEDPRNLAAVLAPPCPGVCELVHTGKKILAPRGFRGAPPYNGTIRFSADRMTPACARSQALADASRIAAKVKRR